MQNLQTKLDKLKEEQLYRSLKTCESFGAHIIIDKKKYLNFSSNDYLGLSQNKNIIKTSVDYLKKYGAGATSSRLICGNGELTQILEEKIKILKNRESVLLFSNGYMANLGIITTLTNKNTMIFFDRLSHASIIDGVKLSEAKWARFNHNDMSHLNELLEKYKNISDKLIISESVFSMDGDLANIDALAIIAKKHDTDLLIDEAHATGIFGGNLEGLVASNKYPDIMIMGTLGKALGSYGAYFCGKKEIREYLINKSRTLIYTTALPPATIGASIGAIDYLSTHKSVGKELLKKAKYLIDGFNAMGINIISEQSQIIPIMAGTNEKALHLAEFYYRNKILAIAVRPPTVPKGESRIRLTVTLEHTQKDLDLLLDLTKEYKTKYGL